MNCVSILHTKVIIRSLMSSAPKTGLAMSVLDRNYRRRTGHRIPFDVFGFSSLEEFLMSLDDTLQIELRSNGEYHVYELACPETNAEHYYEEVTTPWKNYSKCSQSMCGRPPATLPKTFVKKSDSWLPLTDIVPYEQVYAPVVSTLLYESMYAPVPSRYATYIEPAGVPREMHPGTLIRIFINEINNPFSFWFNLQADRHPLEVLISQIDKVYSAMKPAEHCIRRVNALAGQLCAVFYLGTWQRGEIVHTGTANQYCSLNMHLIDYGPTVTIRMEHIKYLLSDFAERPGHVYRGRLENIEAFRMHLRKYEKYAMTMLTAWVTEIDTEENIVQMRLINTQNHGELWF